jgi:hypothetical protein
MSHVNPREPTSTHLPAFKLREDCVTSRVLFYGCFVPYFLLAVVLFRTLFGYLELDGVALRTLVSFDTLNVIAIAVLAVREILFGRWNGMTVVLFALLAVVGVSACIGGWHLFAFSLAIVFAARDFDLHQLAKVFFFLQVALMVVTIACSQVGVLPDPISDLDDPTARHRHFLGFVHPNTSGVLMFSTVACAVYARGENIRVIEVVLLAAATVALYAFDGCRAMLAAVMLLLVASLLFARRDLTRPSRLVPKLLTAAVPITLALGMVVVCCNYDPDVGWMAQLDHLLSGRVRLSSQALHECAIGLLPMGYELPHRDVMALTPDGTFELRNQAIPIDCIYIKALLSCGFVPYVLFLASLALAGYRSWDAENPQAPLILLVIFFYGLCEGVPFMPSGDVMALLLGFGFAATTAVLPLRGWHARTDSAPPTGD